jgi:hypothetical protein
MLAEALTHKELLVQHGLAEPLLEGLVRSVSQIDQALEQAADARRGHVSASAELDLIGDEITHLISVMGTFNGFRFAEQGAVLAEWESASNVFGPVRANSEEPVSQEVPPPVGGEPKAAA